MEWKKKIDEWIVTGRPNYPPLCLSVTICPIAVTVQSGLLFQSSFIFQQ